MFNADDGRMVTMRTAGPRSQGSSIDEDGTITILFTNKGMSRSIDDAGVQPAVRDAGLITILVTFAADSGFVFDVTAHGPHPLGSDIFEGCFDAVLAALG